MRIGIGTKLEEGKFQFTVAAPFLPALQMAMERNDSEVAKAPRYHFLYGGERCGAMWRRTPNGGGESYLSGHIESPIFPGGKLEVAAFVAKVGGEGLMDLVWTPPRPSRANDSEQAGSDKDAF
jgi:uncharacterized protein (DUF736 family)